ncbi:hypothetical protein KSP39_PZI023004 [Platanthera zijinensis]|uniref:Uncharacterized protein n=1 Tax=Platanthera zijinensis TaxID=2320716 RepID=A0AAP0AWI6_9ASPA
MKTKLLDKQVAQLNEQQIHILKSENHVNMKKLNTTKADETALNNNQRGLALNTTAFWKTRISASNQNCSRPYIFKESEITTKSLTLCLGGLIFTGQVVMIA